MEDLQSLLEKINRDGVERAEAESKRIVDEAKAKAAAIVKEAQAAADKAKADADQAAADYAKRAAESVGQAARDVVIGVRDAVTALLERLLAQGVDKALADEKTLTDLVATAVKDLSGTGEVTCGPKVAAALKAALTGKKELSVTVDESLRSGFTVKVDGGRIEHTFTGDVIAAELARRLRPDLAKLVLGA